MLPERRRARRLDGMSAPMSWASTPPRWARTCSSTAPLDPAGRRRGPDARSSRSVDRGGRAVAAGAPRDVDSCGAGAAGGGGDRKVIGRVDRTELSKNVFRGLLAYRELLRTHARVA